jgi:hypothetical protein
MDAIKQRLIRGFWFTLAVIFLIESWLWDHVKDWLQALVVALGFKQIEARLVAFLTGLSPYATFGVFVIPALVILPLKILAVAMMAEGHVVTGIAIILAAKTLALGVSAFLFEHCRAKLLQIAWFDRFYHLVLRVRAWAHDLVEPALLRIKEIRAQIRRRVDEVFGAGRSQFLHKVALVRAAVKRRGT